MLLIFQLYSSEIHLQTAKAENSPQAKRAFAQIKDGASVSVMIE